MNNLLNLAERCQLVGTFDRQLDRDIGVEVFGWKPFMHGSIHMLQTNHGDFPDHAGALYPSFTELIEDALSLVPEGFEWQISNRAPSPHTGRAYINNKQLQFAGLYLSGLARNPKYIGFETTAMTVALALCIVCLQAHAVLKSEASIASRI